ncbi:uncharacterized protein LOC124927988 [Impatiens glandulifera]|uniref:uncharacterized protein LOC124927988 n=1 Tax=Impatiens glandulifera TaxID=253017 RepID=UPI001FB1A203|nr:uncharacterized protein LOC124927988 [Impatiens glandulifera]
MEVKDKKSKKNKNPDDHHQTTNPCSNLSFKPTSDVKGLRFGGQIVVKSFNVRRARRHEFLRLLSLSPPPAAPSSTFSSITVYLPTNFTILAHTVWHTLTLGLGTKKSKVILFVFESETMKDTVDRIWPAEIPLGEVNKKMIRKLIGCEMARFKFRKGCITFYVYAVRSKGHIGFSRVNDLRMILESVVALMDFKDHTAMLATSTHERIEFPAPV